MLLGPSAECPLALPQDYAAGLKVPVYGGLYDEDALERHVLRSLGHSFWLQDAQAFLGRPGELAVVLVVARAVGIAQR